MRALIQRVKNAAVTIDGAVQGQIDKGLLILLGVLVVSQFTLYGDCKKGKRPNFMRAARPETAIPLYEHFIQQCKASGLPVETGTFGADMQVSLVNDGPVTIWMDTAEMRG